MLTNAWFVGAVWLYFYRLFMSDQQVGLLDGMAFAIGLIAEIPSGALADRWGRDKAVKLGQLFVVSGLLIQAGGSSFSVIFIGQAILMIGVSLISGADEALFFEELNFKKDSLDWRKLVTRGSQFALIGSTLATVAGGVIHTINPRLTFILTAVAFFFATIIIWSIKDTRPQNSRHKLSVEFKQYVSEIKTGFIEFRSPKLWLYVPIIVTVQGVFYAAGWGLLRIVLLDRFHFEPYAGAVVVAASSVITVVILSFMNKYAKSMSEKRVLTIISLGAVASLLLSLGDIGVWGAGVITMLYAGEHILYPFMSEILNNHAPIKQRATVLSIASFMRMLPYVMLAPIIGYLNTHNQLEYFLIIWALLISAAIATYLLIKKRDDKVEVELI